MRFRGVSRVLPRPLGDGACWWRLENGAAETLLNRRGIGDEDFELFFCAGGGHSNSSNSNDGAPGIGPILSSETVAASMRCLADGRVACGSVGCCSMTSRA